MEIKSSRTIQGLVALAIAAGSAVAVTTFAEAQTATPPQAPMPGHAPMRRDALGPMHGGHEMAEVERLKTSLKLSPSQAASWDRAAQMMRPSGDPRAEMRARGDRMGAMLDDPDFDPRKLAAEMDSAEAERHARMVAVRDAWISVYTSLTPVQRGQVREFLRSRMSGHRKGRMEWMHRHEDGHDGEHDGGRHEGMPPMPPAPR